MKTTEIVLFGGAGLVLLYLLKGNGSISLPGSTPDNIGINSGQLGGNGSFNTVANYEQLLAANPNLGNPNYQMNGMEAGQYLSNYLDLRQGIGAESGGLSLANVNKHWHQYGCAEKRIFLPLQPPSMVTYIPPPKSASGSSWTSWIGTALEIAAAIAGTDQGKGLNDKEIEVLITGGAILTDILPFYQLADPQRVLKAETKLQSLLLQYI